MTALVERIDRYRELRDAALKVVEVRRREFSIRKLREEEESVDALEAVLVDHGEIEEVS